MSHLRERALSSLIGFMDRRPRTADFAQRARFWLEDKNLLSPYSRLIVVCGMARTGTTAVAAYIGSHPEIRLIVSGAIWFRAETDIVKGNVDWTTIDKLLREHRPKRILVKCPWLEAQRSFFQKAWNAKVVVCFRKPETLFESWGRSGMAGDVGKRTPREVYDKALPPCKERLAAGALRMDQEELGIHQAKKLGEFLGVNPEGFDPKRMRRRWLGLEERPWLWNKTLWLDKQRWA